jgi:hypothetical protein
MYHAAGILSLSKGRLKLPDGLYKIYNTTGLQIVQIIHSALILHRLQ